MLSSRQIRHFALALLLASSAMGGSPLTYPESNRTDHVDTYHGVEVADPYRWLEQDVRESDEVADWVKAQSSFTADYLGELPGRKAIEQRLTHLWNYEKYSSPFKRGGRYYFSKNDGLQNQSVVYRMDTLDGEPVVLIDPNGWTDDGTRALAGLGFSDDGRYVAYGVADSGSDWRTWRVMEIESGKILDDALSWVKFSSATWTRDSKGFFYGRYDPPKDGTEFQGLNLNQKLYYHRVGTNQSEDVLVHMNPDHPDWGFGTAATEDGRYLVITVWKGTDNKYRVLYKDLTEPYGMPVTLVDHFDDEYSFIGNDNKTLYFKTDRDAPMGRVVAIDLRHPEPEHWREVIPEATEPLTGVTLLGNMFVTRYLKDAKTRVLMYDVNGKLVREVSFPSIGSASGFSGRRTDTETFYSFSSFATPPSIYSYDMITGKSTLMRQAKVDFDPGDYEVKQVFFDSLDGTKVPMFIAHKAGVELDGTNPTLLYGYGGFNISLGPHFSISKLGWMELGGVYALANLRGGGEYGEEWHKAGTKLEKQNVFDDFIAAAEWLIENEYTSSEHLGVQGGSNGGLLVGAVMTQRPELFAACLPAVGVMDMLRFHKFTAGRFWTDDYGSSDNADEFKALLAYSPYHNLKSGTAYPPTLVTTADTDDRVVPGHSFKFAAELQHAQAGDNPVLIRIESRAGHGAGTPTLKLIKRVSDEWAFLAHHLGMQISSAGKTSISVDKTAADAYP